jgi:hypothetical protein
LFKKQISSLPESKTKAKIKAKIKVKANKNEKEIGKNLKRIQNTYFYSCIRTIIRRPAPPNAHFY